MQSVRRLRLPFANKPSRRASTFVQNFNQAIDELPMRDAFQYKEKSIKWTANEFREFVHAHANAFIDLGYKPNETLAVWLPNKPERLVTLTAAALAGFKVVEVKQEDISSVSDLRQFLSLANPKCIVFEPVSLTQDNLKLLRQAIPEFFYYDDTHGQIFHSKHWPALRHFLHTGFDIEMGARNYKHWFLPSPPVNMVDQYSTQALNDQSPVYSLASKGADGKLSLSPAVSLKDLPSHPQWAFLKDLLAKQHLCLD